MSTPVIILSQVEGSFPFEDKTIKLPSGTKTILGSTETVNGVERIPSSTNGFFPPKETEDSCIPSVSPLSLSLSHAEIWYENGQTYIKDLDSAFGTYVNGLRVSNETILKSGDIIRLGFAIGRNSNTPAYITDFHLSPVLAKVSLSGL